MKTYSCKCSLRKQVWPETTVYTNQSGLSKVLFIFKPIGNKLVLESEDSNKCNHHTLVIIEDGRMSAMSPILLPVLCSSWNMVVILSAMLQESERSSAAVETHGQNYHILSWCLACIWDQSLLLAMQLNLPCKNEACVYSKMVSSIILGNTVYVCNNHSCHGQESLP